MADQRRRSRIPAFLGVALLAAAAAVALILILSGIRDESMSVSMPVVFKANCEPIIASGSQNGGKTYVVISSATDGNPASCGVARSVLLTALDGGGSTIGGWHCTTLPSAITIASCTSVGGRRIKTRG
jgi:hypothetical protein